MIIRYKLIKNYKILKRFFLIYLIIILLANWFDFCYKKLIVKVINLIVYWIIYNIILIVNKIIETSSQIFSLKIKNKTLVNDFI